MQTTKISKTSKKNRCFGVLEVFVFQEQLFAFFMKANGPRRNIMQWNDLLLSRGAVYSLAAE